MSSSSIDRWNSIPLTRDSQSAPNKRPRSHDDHNDDEEEGFDRGGLSARGANDDGDSSEDNVSIVSRSPSPQPNRDVDMNDISLYDEHIRGAAREVITVETKIKATNKGFAMLAKMGWIEGTPLGLSGEGRIDPIPFTIKQDSQGLGKSSQDFRMIETTVAQRRNLDSERMQFETEEQRLQREAVVAQKNAVRSEISAVLRPFYCELCDKQFQNVAQYDEHTNSYAHHHRVRLKDMKSNHPMKVGGQVEIERRKEKERKREEKELRKMAKAVGIKMPVPSPAVPATTAAAAAVAQPPNGGGFKKSGWASVASSATASSSSGRGWAAVSAPASPSAPRTSSGGSGSGWRNASTPNDANPCPPPPPGAPPLPVDSLPSPTSTATASAFVSGGWSMLTQSSSALSSERPPSPAPPTAPPPMTHPPPPPFTPAPQPPPAAELGGTAGGPSSPQDGWTRVPSTQAHAPIPTHAAPIPPPPSAPTSSRSGSEKRTEGGSRSWQNFQKSRGRR